MLDATLSLVFPAECEICGSSTLPSPAMSVCEKCRSEIKLIPAPHCASCGRTVTNGTERCGRCFREVHHFDRAYACAFYEGNMKKLLHIYKFGGRKYLKHFFSETMARFADQHLDRSSFHSVVAVPMARGKENERGFNQSKKISAKIAEKFGVPDDSGKLLRVKPNATQHFLTKQARKRNVEGAFRVNPEGFFRPKNVLLIDDILTTGQTASECAKVLKNAGAASVTVLACARGI